MLGLTITIEGWDWLWLILATIVGSFFYGFFSALIQDWRKDRRDG